MEQMVSASVDAGSPVEVLPRGGGGPWCEGILHASRGFVVEVTFEGRWPLKDGQDVILASGSPGNRVAALARFWLVKGNAAIFKRMSPWRPVDTRAFTRFAVQLRAHVRDDSGNNRWTGATIDLSLGGLAVTVPGTVGSGIVEVALGGPDAPFLPCRVVGVDEEDDGTVLHLAFISAGEAERAVIQSLVDELSFALELAAAS
jgi:hypothetical protein